MEVLEQILRKIDELRRDLSAEILIQEEEGHEEPISDHNAGWDADSRWIYSDETQWVVDKPEIREPDKQKREAARTKLQQIYDSSEWYSARYKAGKALDTPTEKLNEQPDLWLKELEKELDAEKLVHFDGPSSRNYREAVGGTSADWRGVDLGEAYDAEIPDHVKRLKAIKDTAELLRFSNYNSIKKLLQRAYDSNIVPDVRKQAGKYLGKGRFRIWFHDLRR